MILRNALLAAALTVLSSTAAPAQHATVNAIEIDQPWTRATAPSAKNGGAFMTIRNTGAEPDRLVAAATPAASRSELHTHTMTDGMMRMRPVEGGIAVPAGGSTKLAPGGLHIMMMGLTAPLAVGGSVAVTLTFERAGSVTVAVPVMKAGAAKPIHGSGTKSMEGHGGVKAMPHPPGTTGAPVHRPGGIVRP